MIHTPSELSLALKELFERHVHRGAVDPLGDSRASKALALRLFGWDADELGPEEALRRMSARKSAYSAAISGAAFSSAPPASASGPAFLVRSKLDPGAEPEEVRGWDALAARVGVRATTCRTYSSFGDGRFETKAYRVERKS